MKPPRKQLTKALSNRINAESQGCPWCKVNDPETIPEIHHIDGDSTNNVPENLIAACPTHHDHITRGVIQWADVKAKKAALLSPAEGVRIGVLPDRYAAPQEADAAVKNKKTVIVNGDKNVVGEGITVTQTTNHYGNARVTRAPAQDSIAASAAHKNYVNYLFGRWAAWSLKEQKRSGKPSKGPTTAWAAKHVFESEWRTPALDFELSRFDEVCDFLKGKIDRTVWGRKSIHRNYHSFEEHGKPKARRKPKA